MRDMWKEMANTQTNSEEVEDEYAQYEKEVNDKEKLDLMDKFNNIPNLDPNYKDK